MRDNLPARKFRALRRQHKLERARVDAIPWPHPRPLQDERQVWLNVLLIPMSVIQAAGAAAPNSVQAQGFGLVGTLAFALLTIICCGMNLYATWTRSQYISFGVEMGATIGFFGAWAIYLVGLAASNPYWYGTSMWWIGTALLLGNLQRGLKLIRRLW